MNTYGKHGVTRLLIEQEIDGGLEKGFSHQTIYTGLRMAMGNIYNEREYFTPAEVAEALGATENEIIHQIDLLGNEMEAKGEDPSNYFTKIEPEVKQRFVVLPSGLK